MVSCLPGRKDLTIQPKLQRELITADATTMLTCFADLEPIAVVHLHLPHQHAR